MGRSLTRFDRARGGLLVLLGALLALAAPGGSAAPEPESLTVRVRLSTGALPARVAELPLEEYVAGVLAAEAAPSFHPEALKAMAVAVRTYALRARLKHGPEADVCDTVHCQVYAGESDRTPFFAEVARATAGLVAAFEGEPIDAVHSTACGGHTEASEAAWSGARAHPYLRPVPDAPEPGGEPYCALGPAHQWEVTLPAERLRQLGGLPEAAEPVLEIVSVTESGRAREVRVRAADGGAGRSFTGPEWRRLVGAGRLRSLRFAVTPAEAGGALLTGSGAGHGVGLCQWGAHGFALSEAEPTFREILAHYYRGVTLEPALALPPRPGSGGRATVLPAALPGPAAAAAPPAAPAAAW